jgi:hypothetical protein
MSQILDKDLVLVQVPVYIQCARLDSVHPAKYLSDKFLHIFRQRFYSSGAVWIER